MKTLKYLDLDERPKGWYPVSLFGWLLTLVYIALLIYVVYRVNADLYASDERLFYASILFLSLIVVTLLIARMRGEQPFRKK